MPVMNSVSFPEYVTIDSMYIITNKNTIKTMVRSSKRRDFFLSTGNDNSSPGSLTVLIIPIALDL